MNWRWFHGVRMSSATSTATVFAGNTVTRDTRGGDTFAHLRRAIEPRLADANSRLLAWAVDPSAYDLVQVPEHRRPALLRVRSDRVLAGETVEIRGPGGDQGVIQGHPEFGCVSSAFRLCSEVSSVPAAWFKYGPARDAFIKARGQRVLEGVTIVLDDLEPEA